MLVLGPSQRGHSVGNCNPEDSACGVNTSPLAVDTMGSKPIRGGAVTWLTVPHPEGDTLYATREGVESQGVPAIEKQYKVAWGAPILQDAWLHGNFVFLANTVLAD
jgi:hypothetical protein